MLDPLQSEPALVDLVHERLVEAISVGRLAPGERLTQGHVADLLDVSRQPVSHALQLLKHQGLAVQHGRKGLAVAPMDAMQIWNLYQIRGALDGLAARLAATRVRDGLVSEAELGEARAALVSGKSLGPESGIIELVRADVAFHQTVHALSGNPEIARTVTDQWPQFMRSMAAFLDEPDRSAAIWDEHTEIFDVICAGDAEKAETLASEHALRAGANTQRRLLQLDQG